jgi:hypothetical protein
MIVCCCNRNSNNQGAERTTVRVYLFCSHMVLFCIVLMVEHSSHILAYTTSHFGYQTMNKNYEIPAKIFYYIYTSSFMLSLGQYIILISQVFHIWLKVIQAIAKNLLQEYIVKIVFVYLIILNIIAVGACISGTVLFTLPDHLLNSTKKKRMIIALMSIYGIMIVTLSISMITGGVFIVFQLCKSIRIFQTKGRYATVIKIALFLAAFVVAVFFQCVSLVIRDHLPVYVKAVVLDMIPPLLLIVFMSIAFWPASLTCNYRRRIRPKVRRELSEHFIDAVQDDTDTSTTEVN